MTRVALLADEGLAGAGLRALLEERSEIVVIGEFGIGHDIRDDVARLEPDVIIADIDLPDDDQAYLLELLLESAEKLPPVLVLVTKLSERVIDLVHAGARGVLLKRDGSSELVAAIRVIAAGYGVLCSPMLGRVAGHSIGAYALKTRGRMLSEREAEVLALVGCGMSNAEIARALFVEDSTVKSHIKHIVHKLGLRDRTQVAIFACQLTALTTEKIQSVRT